MYVRLMNFIQSYKQFKLKIEGYEKRVHMVKG